MTKAYELYSKGFEYHKYGNLEFSKKNEQSLIDEICLHFRHKIYVESKL